MKTDEELRKAISGLFWYHSLELRPGIITPGVAAERFVLPLLGIPEDLTGKTVLDIGCWDGFFSFECERRGGKVVASDVWKTSGRGAFDFAREELGSEVEPWEMSVYSLPKRMRAQSREQFDLVLFLGVLYHLKHPLLALEQVAACTKPGGLAIIDTVVDTETLFDERPVMAFYPGDELNHDPTNWWVPNISALGLMLQVAGFTETISRVQVHGGNRTIFHAVKGT